MTDNTSRTDDPYEHDASEKCEPKDGVISVRGVRFGYGDDRAVVDDVSFELFAGRVCALIGPNAAGKSTLVKLILGQLDPWEGEVLLDGKDVGRIDAGARACRMSYVPQRGAVSFAFTVREVVSMGRFAAGSNEEAIVWAMDRCDLGEVQDTIFAELSGGQQQRVMIARALAQGYGMGEKVGKGGVFVLDEPGSNLDLWHVQQMMHVLRERAVAGDAVLVVMHDLNLTARYADDVVLLDHGKVVAKGGWRKVMNKEMLEPVYRVKMRELSCGTEGGNANGGDRPMFWIEDAVE
ncbi:ABC transporter ATP-binding protein [Poriferisphaera sp. WC338]|uniref:ABC transporter ATP-binding protein n=1 Tax=Poriferisphaera sp. WC338 TaxID=3425129 RepID=UPI003D81A85F